MLSFILLACTPEAVQSPSIPQNPTCDLPQFELLGDWRNTTLPMVSTPDHIHDPGVGIGDLDGDGDEDVLYAWSGNTQLFVNDGQGHLSLGGQILVDGQPILPARSVALSDLDYDGDLDILLGYDAPHNDTLLWNQGTGLSYHAQALPDSEVSTWTNSFADFNQDGRLDIYSATYDLPYGIDLQSLFVGAYVGSGHAFYMQEDNQQWSRHPVPSAAETGLSLQGAIIDIEQDGLPDVYMVNDFGPYVLPSQMLHNEGNGVFTVDTDCQCTLSGHQMGGGVGDSNGDGQPDMLITDVGMPHLMINDGQSAFYEATLSALALTPSPQRMSSWGAAFVDLDLDGDDDIGVAFGEVGGLIDGNETIEDTEQYATVLYNDGSGNFEVLDSERLPALDLGRTITVADLDGDPRPDLVFAGRNGLQAWLGTGGCDQSIVLSLSGPPGNSEAFGTRVVTEVDGHQWTRWLWPGTTGSQSSTQLFLGLAEATQANRLTITWPDGQETVLEDVPAGPLRVTAP